ncbi:hypothetical protein KGF57_001977 [Candida theae]|uniref:DNA-directed RNA polymerase III subunit RPC9 n=1 Tax=Candida theae TaxID=1198502 RepID=A0AAD5BGH5_9ASCO|nr:uncharacterized protein KGF57_001977 [Candida theae]KAI5960033.1 hypothetical protein KGF57_001977 [Candida theae]
MQVVKERDAFLSNFEVYEHLKHIKHKYNWTFSPEEELALQQEQQQQQQQQQQQEHDHNNSTHHQKKHLTKSQKNRFTACGINLEVVTRDVLRFMEKNAEITQVDTDNFKQLMSFLNQFELMKVEKLQIVNCLPRSLVVLYLLIEECEERFSVDVCEGIVGRINELFPVEAEEEDGEEGEVEVDGEVVQEEVVEQEAN